MFQLKVLIYTHMYMTVASFCSYYFSFPAIHASIQIVDTLHV